MAFADLKGFLLILMVALVVALGAYGNSVLHERAALRLQVASQNETIRLMGKTEKVTTSVLTTRIENVRAIQKKARDVQQKVQMLRPGAACELPPDWRLLHDEAAAGAVPAAPDGADAAPSTTPEVTQN